MTRTTQVLEELLILILMLIISNKATRELGFESDSFQVLYLLHRLQRELLVNGLKN